MNHIRDIKLKKKLGPDVVAQSIILALWEAEVGRLQLGVVAHTCNPSTLGG